MVSIIAQFVSIRIVSRYDRVDSGLPRRITATALQTQPAAFDNFHHSGLDAVRIAGLSKKAQALHHPHKALTSTDCFAVRRMIVFSVITSVRSIAQ
jgi:hypothetical protein